MNIIEEIIYPVLQEFKEEEEFDYELSPELKIFGEGSVFDSLTLVRFVIAIQDQILEVTDKTVVLATQQAMSRSNSPFRTVTTLSEYIDELLAEAK